MHRNGFDSSPGTAVLAIKQGEGLSGRSSADCGSGCCGNMEAGMPPGNTGNTGPWTGIRLPDTGAAGWVGPPSMADSTVR